MLDKTLNIHLLQYIRLIFFRDPSVGHMQTYESFLWTLHYHRRTSANLKKLNTDLMFVIHIDYQADQQKCSIPEVIFVRTCSIDNF